MDRDKSKKKSRWEIFERIIKSATNIAIILGIALGIFQLENMKKQQYNSTLLKFQEYWMDPIMENDRTIVRSMNKIEKDALLISNHDGKIKVGERLDQHKALRKICIFFELLGWAFKREYVLLADINCLWGSVVKHYWEKCQKNGAIDILRKKYEDPLIYEHFEILVKKVKEAEKKKRG